MLYLSFLLTNLIIVFLTGICGLVGLATVNEQDDRLKMLGGALYTIGIFTVFFVAWGFVVSVMSQCL